MYYKIETSNIEIRYDINPFDGNHIYQILIPNIFNMLIHIKTIMNNVLYGEIIHSSHISKKIQYSQVTSKNEKSGYVKK